MANGEDKPKKDRPPYFRYAFHNVYNYAVLGGVATAALLTQNWWLAVLGAGMETLWMVFSPDSKLLRKLWFDKVHDAEIQAAFKAERDRMLAGLPEHDKERITALETARLEILRLCNENQAFTAELLREELAKMDQLVTSFIDLSIASNKHEQYLQSVDTDDLEAQIRRHQKIAERAEDDDERKRLAEKNLAVLEKRQETLAEIRRFVARARGQLDLIENTFRLLSDQIVTMRSPRELGGQLDELLDGVESVRSTARETAMLLQAAT